MLVSHVQIGTWVVENRRLKSYELKRCVAVADIFGGAIGGSPPLEFSSLYIRFYNLLATYYKTIRHIHIHL